MKRNQKRKNNKGFSLVELIIVIAIMAILAGILAPQFVKYVNRGKVSTDIQNAQNIASALAVYYADNSDKVSTNFTLVQEKDSAGNDAKMPGGDETIKDILGGIPEVKAEANKVFAFQFDPKGKVTVGIADKNATEMPTDEGHLLYPNQPTTGTWAQ